MGNDFSSDPNCVALWRHENGALTADSIGGNTLTNSGVTADTVNYKEGAASGDYQPNDYQYIADADLDDDFPMKYGGDNIRKISGCMWLYLDTAITAGYDGLASKWGYAGNRVWAVLLRGVSGGPYLGFYKSHTNNTSYEYFEITDHKLQTGRWYHLAWTYNDSSKAYTLTLWDDSTSTKYTKSGTATYQIYVGTNTYETALGRAAGDYPDGRMDEVVIFKDILRAAEITKIRQGIYGGSSGQRPGMMMGCNF